MIPRRPALLLALALATACAPAMTGYAPEHVGEGELTLRYEKRMLVYAGRRPLTHGPVYRGLADYVRCVPRAHEHARYAERYGRARLGLAWSGGALGVASLGGLAGFAYLESDPTTAFALLGTGLATAVLGIVLAGSSRSAGNHAHGNAIDAINYYNDAVGSLGGTCAAPVRAPPMPVPAPPSIDAPPPADPLSPAPAIEGPPPPPAAAPDPG